MNPVTERAGSGCSPPSRLPAPPSACTLGWLLAITLLLVPRPARAVSNYHTSDTLICADCHSMHRSMQHGFQGGSVSSQAVVGGNWLPAGGPNPYLLKLPKDQLCLACHDATGNAMAAPAVVGSTADPAGGSFTLSKHRIDSGGGHVLGAPLKLSKRSGSDSTLGCSTCHSPHGSDSFRNLRSDPAGRQEQHKVLARLREPEAGAARSSAAKLEAAYAGDRIVYESGMSDWCRSCHQDVHGHGTRDTAFDHADGAVLGQSPSVNIDSWLRATDGRVRVEQPGGDGRPSPNDRVFCLTCHRAHGSGNRASLIFADGQTLTSTCQQCHDE